MFQTQVPECKIPNELLLRVNFGGVGNEEEPLEARPPAQCRAGGAVHKGPMQG